MSTPFANGRVAHALLLAAVAFGAVNAGAWAFGPAGFVGYGLTYAVLALLGLAGVLLSEALLDFVEGRPMLADRAQLKRALVLGAGLVFVYGPAIFIKYYEYDDWVYWAYKYQPLSVEYFLRPVNDHFVPILKGLLFLIGRLYEPNYFGNALALYLSSQLTLAALYRVLLRHQIGGGFAFCVALAFSVWPAFETARTWFGGGFWLAVPVAFFLVSLLACRNLLSAAAALGSVRAYFVLCVSGFLVVLSSSQILLPSLFLAVYLLCACLLAPGSTERRQMMRVGVGVLALTFLPSIAGVLGRVSSLSKPLNFSGLLDGAYFRDVGAFVSMKLLLLGEWSRSWPSSCLLLLLTGLVFLVAASQVWQRRSRLNEDCLQTVVPGVALTACGYAMFFFYFLQVGVGRSWEVYAAINAYYACFPLTAAALIVAGLPQQLALVLRLLPPALQWRQIRRRAPKVMRCLPVLLWCVTAYYGFVLLKKSLNDYFPSLPRVETVQQQLRFVDALSGAVCELLRLRNSETRVFLLQERSFEQCQNCTELLKGPPSFMRLVSEDPVFLPVLAKTLAERVCPGQAMQLSLSPEQSESMSGYRESPRMRDFYDHYFPVP